MLKAIHMNRAEGPVAECGKHSCASFHEAHAKIRRWARSAPDWGGYDKTDVTLVFDGIESGEDTSVSLRFDMTRDHATDPEPLLKEFIRHCRFYSGDDRPWSMEEDSYRRIMSGVSTAHRATFRKLAAAFAERV